MKKRFNLYSKTVKNRGHLEAVWHHTLPSYGPMALDQLAIGHYTIT